MTLLAEPHTVQGTAVALDGRAIMFIGNPGVGKSELALALVEQGALFIVDDLVQLRAQSGQIMAGYVPGRASRIMLREIGLVDMEQVIAPMPLALVIELAHAAPAEQLTGFGPRSLGQFGPVGDLHCPKLTLDPRSQTISSKVRLALERWGH